LRGTPQPKKMLQLLYPFHHLFLTFDIVFSFSCVKSTLVLLTNISKKKFAQFFLLKNILLLVLLMVPKPFVGLLNTTLCYLKFPKNVF
jgi:hypothetical protein